MSFASTLGGRIGAGLGGRMRGTPAAQPPSWQQGLSQNLGVLTGQPGAKPVAFAPRTAAPFSPAALGQQTARPAAPAQPAAAPAAPTAAPQAPAGQPLLSPTPQHSAAGMLGGTALQGLGGRMMQSSLPWVQRLGQGTRLGGTLSGGMGGGLSGLGAMYSLNAGLDLLNQGNWNRDEFNRATSVGARGDNLLGYTGPGAKGLQGLGAAANAWNAPAQSMRELGAAGKDLYQMRGTIGADPRRFFKTWYDVHFG